ncbi:MAG: hypothetical protein IJN64_17720 [Lachnospiraceae bacterium]|nr:hypothetical protein [Lachnospiraceae bacterium]
MKKVGYRFKKSILIILMLVSLFCIVKFSSASMWCVLPSFIKRLFERPVEGTNAYEIWFIVNEFCMAYVASLIFYFVVDYIPKKEKEKKAFAIISNNLVTIYDNLSYIIRMILFEIEVDKNIEDITLSDLCQVKSLEFDSITKYADITHVKNGKDIKVKGFSFNLLDKCKTCGESITKTIDEIFSLPVSGNINDELLELLLDIRKCRFLHMLSYFEHYNTRKIPGRRNEILFYDASFFELIQYREVLGKEKFDLLDYRFERMSDEQIEEERERRIYWLGRSYFMRMPVEKIQASLSYMPNILLDESGFHKLNGVLMETLVTYDIDKERYGYMLPIAKSIAEFLRKYEGTEECKDIACLNYLQVLRRMGTISKKDLKAARVIIENPNKPNILRLGALIIVKNYDEAQKVFEDLEENQKLQVLDFPIYRLWKNPPCPANIEQPDFNIYE